MAKNNKYQKLELTWIGKGEEPKLELRILSDNPDYSYGDPILKTCDPSGQPAGFESAGAGLCWSA